MATPRETRGGGAGAKAGADAERVALEWLIAGADEATVERTEDGVAWTALATVAADGSGRIAYEDRAALELPRGELRSLRWRPMRA